MAMPDDYKTPQQAMEWMTTKMLKLDAENLRLQAIITKARAILLRADAEPAWIIPELRRILWPSKEDDR